jgi:hypothetical protein
MAATTAKPAAAVLETMASHVHINITPGTKNLHESRQILAALQKFGEVTTFKNGKVKETSSSLTQPPREKKRN